MGNTPCAACGGKEDRDEVAHAARLGGFRTPCNYLQSIHIWDAVDNCSDSDSASIRHLESVMAEAPPDVTQHVDFYGNNLLVHAHSLKALRILLAAKADVTALNSKGHNMALRTALLRGDDRLLKDLTRAGAVDLTLLRDASEGGTAVIQGNVGVLKLLGNGTVKNATSRMLVARILGFCKQSYATTNGAIITSIFGAPDNIRGAAGLAPFFQHPWPGGQWTQEAHALLVESCYRQRVKATSTRRRFCDSALVIMMLEVPDVIAELMVASVADYAFGVWDNIAATAN